MASEMDTGGIQVLHYLKRNPKSTRDQFWAYRQNIHGPKLVPLAEKYGFTQYQQLHTFGSVIPSSSPASAPNVANVESKSAPAGPIEFDGIAMFLVPSLESFQAAVEDPYYLNVVEPDEHNLLDKNAPGRGVVACFDGQMVPVVQKGVDVTGTEQRAEVMKARETFDKVNGMI